MEKIVWIVRIISKNFMSDFIANVKNILGGRLKGYEKMLDDSLREIVEEFYEKYPNASQVRIEFTEFTQGALAVIVHGVIKNGDE
tara:strand:- start:217 stop:471 length:255 start_codon:yes stop_codon:yes gene_type:complete